MAFIATAIIGGAVLGTVGTAIASSNASSAAKQSAQLQSDAANHAADLQFQVYNNTRNDLLPFQNVGRSAIPYYNSLVPGGLYTGNPALPNDSAGKPVVADGSQYFSGSTGGIGTIPGSTPPQNRNTPVDPGDPIGQVDPINGHINSSYLAQPDSAPGPDAGPAGSPSYKIPSEEGGGPAGRSSIAGTIGGVIASPGGVTSGGQAGGQSPFLTGLESNLPQLGPAAQNSLASFLPGSGNNPLQSALYSYVNGASYTPNPLLTAANNSILGGSANPNSALRSLVSFSSPMLNPSLSAVDNLLGLGSQDPAARQKALEQTPGYQFTLDQGLKATQNGYAAQGLGSSGAAMKGAASFATGLADQTYQSQLNNYLTNYNNQFQNAYNLYNTTSTNALNAFGQQSALAQNAYGQGFTNSLNAYGQQFNNANTAYTGQVNNANNLLTLGSNAAAQTGTIASNTANAAGNYLTGGAAAAAGGIVGSANALNAGITGVANNIAGAGTTAALLGKFGGGTLSGQAGVDALNTASLANPNNNYGSSIFTE